jgi:DNA mismatch endonuclease (patch repair protein)
MQRQARRDTKPELALRRELWRRGLRYRVDVAPIEGLRRRADMLFKGAGLVIYVDGCYWHSCPQHATVPKGNRDWWVEKLQANVSRDRDTDRRLGDAGWQVIRVWEHEPVIDAADRIESTVKHYTELHAAGSGSGGTPVRKA